MKARNYGRIVKHLVGCRQGRQTPTSLPIRRQKAGVLGLTKSLGKELAKFDTSAVNAIHPGNGQHTKMMDNLTKEFIEYMLVRIPARPVPRDRGSRRDGDLAGEQGKTASPPGSVFDPQWRPYGPY